MAPKGNPYLSSVGIAYLTDRAKRLTFAGSDVSLHTHFWGKSDWYGEPQPKVERWLLDVREYFREEIRASPDSPDIGYRPPTSRTELSQVSGKAAEGLPLNASAGLNEFKVSYSCLLITSC